MDCDPNFSPTQWSKIDKCSKNLLDFGNINLPQILNHENHQDIFKNFKTLSLFYLGQYE